MNLAQTLSRCVTLARYHYPSQFGWRLFRVVQRKIRARLPTSLVFVEGRCSARWKPDAQDAYRSISQHRLNLWPDRAAHAGKMADCIFTFLAETRALGRDDRTRPYAMDWNPDAPRLWRFHLQCQESLLEVAEQRGADAAFGLVRSWLDEPRHQSPTLDPDAWHPFCISRRLPVWLALAAQHEVPDSIAEPFWRSLGSQVAWLARNCEWDLGGNHLLENLTALFLAEVYLDLDASIKLDFVSDRLLREFEQQTLPSGEHNERTPTYHALMLLSLMHCVEAAGFSKKPLKSSFISLAERMMAVADWLCQPHGAMPLLGDSVLKETPQMDRMRSWVARHCVDRADRGMESTAATKTAATKTAASIDYWANEPSDGHRILFDVGPLACDHLPAHGHADLLQVVASINGYDAIVDSGNFQYESGELRTRCRQTAAHNVLQVGDLQQCDLWSSFRMGRRGHPVWTKRGEMGGLSWCAAAHDGFGFRAGRAVIATSNSWTILDWFAGRSGNGPATSRLHWHPDWSINPTADRGQMMAIRAGETSQPETCVIRCLGESATLESRQTEYFPDFGVRLKNEVVECAGEFSGHGWLGFQLGFHLGFQLGSQQSESEALPSVTQSGDTLSVAFPDHEPLVWKL